MRAATVRPMGVAVLAASAILAALACADEPLVPEHTCKVDLQLPPGAKVTVDGHDYKEEGGMEFSPLAPGEIYPSQFRIALPGGTEVRRTVLLKGGWHVRWALPASTDKPELVPQTGCQGPDPRVVFSPDQQYALTLYNRVILWDLATGRQLRTYTSGTSTVDCMAFSPDGRRIVVASRIQKAGPPRESKSPFSLIDASHSVEILDTATGKRVRSLAGFPAVVKTVALSPDGQQILTVGARYDQEAKRYFAAAWLWDLAAGAAVQRFNLGDATTGIDLAVFCEDGRHVLFSTSSYRKARAIPGSLSLWDATTGEKARDVYRLKSGSFLRVVASPDCRKVLWQQSDTATLLEVESGRIVFAFRPPPGKTLGLSGFAYSPDGKRVVLAFPRYTQEGGVTQLPALIKPQGWLGYWTRPLAAEEAGRSRVAPGAGVVVDYVVAGSPAEKAGLREGDVVLKMNNWHVVSETEFSGKTAQMEVGDTVVLEVDRKGQRRQIRAVRVELPSEEELAPRHRKAAEAGNATAQRLVGLQYRYGNGVDEDLAEAAKWYRKSADKGNIEAQTGLASMYRYGSGVAKDANEAIRWYRRAAEQGNVDAMYSLGNMYQEGIGPAKDPQESARWFRKAAEKGHSPSQYLLGEAYRKGLGVPKSEDEARKWYRLAADQGHFTAQKLLGDSFHAKAKSVVLYFLDTSTGKTLHAVATPLSSIKGLAFSPDGRRILATGGDALTVLDCESGKAVGTCRFHGDVGTIEALAATPRGLHALCAGKDRATLWDLVGARPLLGLEGYRQISVGRVAEDSPGVKKGRALMDRRYNLVQSSDGSLAVLDVATAQMISLHPEIVSAVHFKDDNFFLSPDNRRLLTMESCFGKPGGFKNPMQATLWDPATGQRLRTFSWPGAIFSAAFSPDGRRVFTSNWAEKGSVAVLWDLSTGEQLRKLERGLDDVGFSPDGRYLVAGSFHFGMWDAASGELVRNFRNEPVAQSVFVTTRRTTALSPDGGLLGMFVSAMGSGASHTSLWDARSAAKLRTWDGDGSAMTFSPSGRQLLILGTVGWKLYDVATGDELASIVCLDNGHDWLVTTPEGLFDGTEGARYKVYYRVGSGLNVVPADRFFQDFFRPGLLATLLRGERPMPDVQLGKAVPPLVRIVSPAPGIVENPQATIEVEAADEGGGVSGLAIFQNGARVLASGPTRQEGKAVHRTFRVALVEGDNRIKVTAASGDGSWESEPAEVLLRYERSMAKSQLHLLAAGINKYADANLNLRYAAKDAEAVALLFQGRGKGLYEAVHVKTLVDQAATRPGIKDALKEVAAKTRPQDTLAVFLAGHGTMIGQRYYFVPHELRKQAATLEEDIRRQGLPADELSELLGSAKALKRLLILDTCASGGALGAVLKARSGFALRGAIERLSRSQGLFTIAAAAATEEAQESKELGHGVLSYALLAGLKGVQAGPLAEKHIQPNSPDRVVDVLEWFTFAASQVPRLTEKYYGAAQDVQTSTQGTSFPILPLEE